MTVPICAVVLAARGGAALRAALDAVAWADERAVLDPAGIVGGADVAAGVHLGRRADELAALGTTPWLLLLAEHEEARPPFPAAAAAAVAAGPAALSPRLELETLGVRFVMPAAPIRLAPRAGCRVELDRGCGPALVAPHPRRRLEATIRARGGDTVADAFELLQAEALVVSRVLGQLGRAGCRHGLLTSPLAASSRVLRARAESPAGLARWVAAVIAGYRVVLAQAQCWEWRHAEPVVIREVG
jgi:hypothetical protein